VRRTHDARIAYAPALSDWIGAHTSMKES